MEGVAEGGAVAAADLVEVAAASAAVALAEVSEAVASAAGLAAGCEVCKPSVAVVCEVCEHSEALAPFHAELAVAGQLLSGAA